MNCPNCNQPLEEGVKFCTNCGAKIEQPAEQPVEQSAEQSNVQSEETPVEKTMFEQSAPFMTPEDTAYEEGKKTANGFAIAGLICSLATPFCVIPLVLSILGLVFGIKKWNSSGKGLAIAGIVISGLKLIALPILTFVIAFILAASGEPYALFLL